ncbi:MAG: GIY-YIG nuclease family protein [Gemmataceae bacterium]|nr:GIY-YIG nuclease family protein [Gemmataceae bacterium]MCI0740097.1 GIY-YIG nuclease family protein [Gemmataceae bacterium]
MQSLFGSLDFGPSSLWPAGTAAPFTTIEGRRAPELSKQVRLLSPRQPGVYGMVDCHGDLIYVGKAKNLRSRLLSYFRPKSRDRRSARIISRTKGIAWEHSPCEFFALLRELELIRRWRPSRNVAGQPLRRQHAYVTLGRAPAPYVFLSRKPQDRASPSPPTPLPQSEGSMLTGSFGPLRVGLRVLQALRHLNDWFGLRDCPQPQPMLFRVDGVAPGSAACLRHELGTCLGPCAALCTKEQYDTQTRRAWGFLEGDDETPLLELDRAMQEAAAAQRYERAAQLRDRRESLAWLRQQLERVREARERFSFVYQVSDQEGKRFWFLIHAGRPLHCLLPPVDRASGRKVHALLQSVFMETGADLARYEYADSTALVLAWFRKHPKEWKKTLQPAQALALCEC